MFETTNQFESLKIDRLMSFLLRNQLGVLNLDT